MADDICAKLAAWADVANISSPRGGEGALAVHKSDLLNRLVYGGELGPSRTPCPVHKGTWSGCHAGWPGDTWARIDPQTHEPVTMPMEVSPILQRWFDEGCRCFQHKGSSCTTGWQPDAACGCVPDAT